MNIIELSFRAQKFLSKIDFHIKSRIENRLKRLVDNPVPSDSKFIGREDGSMIFRYRVGDYRVLYKYFRNKNIILILKIDKRERVYD